MGLPDFLIVGAMKAGTTTLYRDILRHPDLLMPSQKEPDTLVRLNDPEAIRADWKSLFAGAKPGQVKGEASTAYTKRPTHEGMAERARQVCGPNLKILYMKRDPIERLVSQYKHELAHGLLEGDINEAVRNYPHLIDYSRYDWQIAPWRAAFGHVQVMEIDLVKYSADRNARAREVIEFLGLDAAELPWIEGSQIANRADEVKRLKNPLMQKFITSNFYQRRIKSQFSAEVREKVRRVLLPPMQGINAELDDDTLTYIRAALAAEQPGTIG